MHIDVCVKVEAPEHWISLSFQDMGISGWERPYMVLLPKDLERLSLGETVTDCMTHLRPCEGAWTLFYMNLPYQGAGQLKVSYANLVMPVFAWKAILRQIQRVRARLEGQAKGNRRVEESFRVSGDWLSRQARLHGSGTGNVDLILPEGYSSESLPKGENFAWALALAERVSLGSTMHFWERARLELFPERSGDFFWRARSPIGRIILCGGINQDRSGEWSVNT